MFWLILTAAVVLTYAGLSGAVLLTAVHEMTRRLQMKFVIEPRARRLKRNVRAELSLHGHPREVYRAIAHIPPLEERMTQSKSHLRITKVLRAIHTSGFAAAIGAACEGGIIGGAVGGIFFGILGTATSVGLFLITGVPLIATVNAVANPVAVIGVLLGGPLFVLLNFVRIYTLNEEAQAEEHERVSPLGTQVGTCLVFPAFIAYLPILWTERWTKNVEREIASVERDVHRFERAHDAAVATDMHAGVRTHFPPERRQLAQLATTARQRA